MDPDRIERFKPKEVLSRYAPTNFMAVLGEIDGEDAVLAMNKLPFTDADTSLVREPMAREHLSHTDIYTNTLLTVKDKIKCSLIHPADPATIKKYSPARKVVVKETAEDYRSKVLPLALEKGIRGDWIDLVFSQCQGKEEGSAFRTAEKEDVLYVDPDFVILPDLKWSRESVDDIYLLVLFRDPRIYTVREITREHIPMLERAREKLELVLGRNYNVDIDQTKLYFHYHPTFYRLHMHASAIMANWPGAMIGSSVLLHDAIENISAHPGFYRDRTMEIVMSEGSPLFPAFSSPRA